MNSSYLLRFGIFCSLLFVLVKANGFQKSSHPELPNFDQRKPQAQESLRKKNAAAEIQLQKSLPKAQVSYDEIAGSPKWISSPDGFLTGKNAAGRGISPKSAAAFPASEPHRATKAFLKEHSAL